jgi:mannose-6-phosphate isomerase-like protein (cupin superfamily)
MVINGEEHIVRPNDAAFISPGSHHSIANHGDTSFKISWTYASINWSTTPVE